MRPLNKPCTDRWDNSEPGDSTAPALSGSIALLLACQLEAEQRPVCSSSSLPLGYSAKTRARWETWNRLGNLKMMLWLEETS